MMDTDSNVVTGNYYDPLSQADWPPLFISASLVCKSWPDIIARYTFCVQKKGYYKVNR